MPLKTNCKSVMWEKGGGYLTACGLRRWIWWFTVKNGLLGWLGLWPDTAGWFLWEQMKAAGWKNERPGARRSILIVDSSLRPRSCAIPNSTTMWKLPWSVFVCPIPVCPAASRFQCPGAILVPWFSGRSNWTWQGMGAHCGGSQAEK